MRGVRNQERITYVESRIHAGSKVMALRRTCQRLGWSFACARRAVRCAKVKIQTSTVLGEILDVQQKTDSCPQLAVILGWQVSSCEFCRSGGFQCLFLNTFSHACEIRSRKI